MRRATFGGSVRRHTETLKRAALQRPGDLVAKSGLRAGPISIEADGDDCERPSVPGSPTSRLASSEETEVVGDYSPTLPAQPTEPADSEIVDELRENPTIDAEGRPAWLSPWADKPGEGASGLDQMRAASHAVVEAE